ncbi:MULTISPECIES: outer membrane beta-barrel protein [unclassified Myroides]|uniref:outer membrane beta-barrel protein n=1 Tax=unclassified Myroides TaxID=2642485 RepID=UPI003D2F587F
MKLKLHLTLLLLFLCVYSSHAQYGGYRHVNSYICYSCDFGIEVGALMSNIKGLDASEKPGFYIGLYNIKEFNENWALRFGLGYANLGAKTKELNTNIVLHTALIEPVRVNYTFRNKIKTFVGMNIGMTMLGKNPFNEDQPELTFFPKGIRMLDYSLFAGAGYKLTDQMDLNLKYDLGLNNINELENSKDRWKKNWLMLSAAYTF